MTGRKHKASHFPIPVAENLQHGNIAAALLCDHATDHHDNQDTDAHAKHFQQFQHNSRGRREMFHHIPVILQGRGFLQQFPRYRKLLPADNDIVFVRRSLKNRSRILFSRQHQR